MDLQAFQVRSLLHVNRALTTSFASLAKWTNKDIEELEEVEEGGVIAIRKKGAA